jgi:transcriptional regulator with PAS, ATPase and Fis domain
MSLATQAKLLRVLEYKEFERLGGESTVHSDFRIIIASNTDLEKAVKNGTFREDLYYRLKVTGITIPPLRERRSDIPLLVEHFLKKYYLKTGRLVERVTDQAMNQLISFDWPGNIRQLQNVLENALVMERSNILSSKYLPGTLNSDTDNCKQEKRIIHYDTSASLNEIVGSFEAVIVREALEKCAWDRQRAAKLLGVHLNTVKNKISKHSISKPK